MMGDVLSSAQSDGELSIFVVPYGMPECSASSLYYEAATAQRYRELQQKYGDNNPTATTFRYYKNSKQDNGWRMESGECRYDCYSDKIDKITVTSTKDWGADYPAGTDLAPLFVVHFSSLAQYVERGFTGDARTNYSEPLSQVDPALFNLMSADKFSGFTLSTNSQPEDYATHTLSVTLTLDTSEEIVYSTSLSSTQKF